MLPTQRCEAQPSRLDLGQAFPQDGPQLQPHWGHLLPVPSATFPLLWGVSPQRLPRPPVLRFMGTQTKMPGDSSLRVGQACAVRNAEPPRWAWRQAEWLFLMCKWVYTGGDGTPRTETGLAGGDGTPRD